MVSCAPIVNRCSRAQPGPGVSHLPSPPVAVGTIIADRPPHRSVLALLTHTALALDHGVKQPCGDSPSRRPCQPCSSSDAYLCSTALSVLRHHPTPHCRACRTCGFRLLRPDCRWRVQSVMRSPGSRACNFAACQGSQTTWVRRPASDVAPRQRVAFPFRPQGRRPQFVVFEAQYPARRCPCLCFEPHLTVHSARLGVRMDSLLLSCRTLSFPIACRFIPALRPSPRYPCSCSP